jgi:hypothetical protein
MRRSTWWLTAVLLTATAQAGAQTGHGHGPGGGDAQPHRRVEACQREFDQVVAEGRGAGLAFVADQNGYPGPLHALELKDRLRLTPDQETRMRALLDAMFAEARLRAARLAEAEARLRRLRRGQRRRSHCALSGGGGRAGARRGETGAPAHSSAHT